MADADAAAEPEMAPKSIFASTFTIATPPGIPPTSTRAKSIRRMAIPPLFMMFPAKIKNGIASKAKLSRPVAIRCENVVRAGITSILTNMVKIPEIPILNAMGTPMTSKTIKLKMSTNISRNSISLFFPVFFNHVVHIIHIEISDQNTAQRQYQVNNSQRHPQSSRLNRQVKPGINQP